MSTVEACVIVNMDFKNTLTKSDVKDIKNIFNCNIAKIQNTILQTNNTSIDALHYKYLIDLKNNGNKIPLLFESNYMKILKCHISYYNNMLSQINNYKFYMLFLVKLDDSITKDNINNDITNDILIEFFEFYGLRPFNNCNYVFFDYRKDISIILTPTEFYIDKSKTSIIKK